MVKMLPMLGIRYARTVKATGKFVIPNNFLEWRPTAHHNDEKLFELLEKFKRNSTSAYKIVSIFHLPLKV